MYIMAKQLSNAKPTKKRQTVNCQKLFENAVNTPAINPIILAPTRAGTRPYLSAIHPQIIPPKIAPTKNILCEIVGNAALSQTQSF